MFDLDIARMGYTILYKNDKSFFGKMIEKTQIKRGVPAEFACYTHVEISGGGQWAVNVAPPKIRISDVSKVHKGRIARICRYKGIDYEDRKRYKIAFWAASMSNLDYDIPGVLRFILPIIAQFPSSFFCSEGWLWAHRREYPEIFKGVIPANCMPGHIAASRDMETVWEGLI
jgi:hypothetical protein